MNFSDLKIAWSLSKPRTLFWLLKDEIKIVIWSISPYLGFYLFNGSFSIDEPKREKIHFN